MSASLTRQYFMKKTSKLVNSKFMFLKGKNIKAVLANFCASSRGKTEGTSVIHHN